MRKLLILLLWLLTLLSFAQQTETFDGITFTVPAGWKNASSTPGVSAFSITNNQSGAYALVAVYAVTPTKGNVHLDFKREWDALIVKPYQPSEDPTVVPTESQDGWIAKCGTAPFEFSGSRSAAMLIVISGYGKCVSVVVVTNTTDYQSATSEFLESLDLSQLASYESSSDDITEPSAPTASPYQFSISNFDDGWTSTVQNDWVEVAKGHLKVLIHYPNPKADEYNPVLLDKLINAWNVLVAPKYSSASNLEFKPVSSWQSVEFAEADAVERATGKTVHVVLFRYNYSGGNSSYMEFIAPNKEALEQAFCPYHNDTSGWEKMEAMAGYNKFAVAASDLTGTWSKDFSGSLHYVNVNTGNFAGMTSHRSNEKFEFGPDNTYRWSLGSASGEVGNLKFQSAKSNGNFSLPNNWQISFSDIEGKPRTFNAHFACTRDSRILWLGDSAYGKLE